MTAKEIFLELLKPDGKLVILFMSWLPFEDETAAGSESLVLKYNPDWSGKGFRSFRYSFPSWAEGRFEIETIHSYNVNLTFTREAWLGRIISCRGVGARLSKEMTERFENEYRTILSKYDETLSLKHQIHIEIYRSTKSHG